jgi:exodeoxyribonuclease V gamma subunit
MYAQRGTLPPLVDGSRAPDPDLAQITLDELKRFIKHPARYFLREVLQLDLETRVAKHQNDEPLSISGLEEYELRQRLFDAVRTDGPLPESPPDVIRAQGLLPPPPLDTAPYIKARTELNDLLPLWERMRPADDYEVVPVDIRLSPALRLTGRLGDVRPHGLSRIEARKAGAGQLLPHWIDLLALAATTGRSTLECCALEGKGGLTLRLGSLTAADALRHLQVLAELYVHGQQRPLCFLPNLSREYVDMIDGEKPRDPDEALARCNDSLADSFRPRWAARDEWFIRVLQPGPHPLGDRAETSEFCRLAVAILAPMERTLAPVDAGQWLQQPADGAS